MNSRNMRNKFQTLLSIRMCDWPYAWVRHLAMEDGGVARALAAASFNPALLPAVLLKVWCGPRPPPPRAPAPFKGRLVSALATQI